MDWKRIRWPDAKFGVTRARSERCEVRSEKGALGGKREESREKREERREKREERNQHDSDERVEGHNGAVPGRRNGAQKGRPLGGQREESREKTEERREEMAASSIHCIFTVSRAHLEKVMKIKGGHRNGR